MLAYDGEMPLWMTMIVTVWLYSVIDYVKVLLRQVVLVVESYVW